MSDEKKDSGFRGRIDRFFDKQAKEQQNLLKGKVGESSIKESWEEVKVRLEVKNHQNLFPRHTKLKIQKLKLKSPTLKKLRLALWLEVLSS